MVTPDLLGLGGLGALDVRIADDRQVVPVRFQRTQHAGPEVEAAARFRGRPEVLTRAPRVAARRTVDHLDGHETGAVQRGASPGDGPAFARGSHGVQERQGNAGAKAAQEGSARQVPAGNDMHRGQPPFPFAGSSSTMTGAAFMRKASLVATPTMNADTRVLFGSMRVIGARRHVIIQSAPSDTP